MSNRFFLLFAILIASTCLDSAGADRPHIVLVMADDMGYGDAGYTGHPFVKTPHLDAMAEAGVVFDRFYAGAPVCSPTRASVMTGRHPFRGNVPNHGHYLRPDEITIAEALKDSGYVTGHFGKWHIGSVQAESPTSPGGQGFDEWLSGLNFFDNNPYLSRKGQFEHIKGPGSVISMDATIDFLKKCKDGDKPMFAVCWFPSPHDPQAELPQNIPNADSLYSKDTKKPGYFREITLLDEQIGKLREALRELEIESNTLFWYTSDNGGLMAESSGGRARKGSIYEGGLRVPSIIEWPAKFQSQRVTTPAYSSDIYPTILPIAGAKVARQPRLDGIDLAEIISGAKDTRPPMGFWHNHSSGQSTKSDQIIKALMEAQKAGDPNPHPERVLKNVREFPKFTDKDLKGHSAWNDWPWKLHRIQKDKKISYELYHLVDDPMETTDLSEKEADRVTEMKAALETWQCSVLNSWSGADYAK
ncbi:MAG: sulfatase-like hydrolase/transferase [Verrucomicrobiales bacterium]|nr:sulfatase-like hydrolase/transferase [Verrucomicrobiales bacterium]